MQIWFKSDYKHADKAADGKSLPVVQYRAGQTYGLEPRLAYFFVGLGVAAEGAAPADPAPAAPSATGEVVVQPDDGVIGPKG